MKVAAVWSHRALGTAPSWGAHDSLRHLTRLAPPTRHQQLAPHEELPQEAAHLGSAEPHRLAPEPLRGHCHRHRPLPPPLLPRRRLSGRARPSHGSSGWWRVVREEGRHRDQVGCLRPRLGMTGVPLSSGSAPSEGCPTCQHTRTRSSCSSSCTAAPAPRSSGACSHRRGLQSSSPLRQRGRGQVPFPQSRGWLCGATRPAQTRGRRLPSLLPALWAPAIARCAQRRSGSSRGGGATCLPTTAARTGACTTRRTTGYCRVTEGAGVMARHQRRQRQNRSPLLPLPTRRQSVRPPCSRQWHACLRGGSTGGDADARALQRVAPARHHLSSATGHGNGRGTPL